MGSVASLASGFTTPQGGLRAENIPRNTPAPWWVLPRYRYPCPWDVVEEEDRMLERRHSARGWYRQSYRNGA